MVTASEFGQNFFQTERYLTGCIGFHLKLILKQLIRSQFSVTDTVLVSSADFIFPEALEEKTEFLFANCMKSICTGSIDQGKLSSV